MNSSTWIVAVITAITAPLLIASTSTYKLANYPLTLSECGNQRLSLAEDLARMAQVEVTRVACTPVTAATVDIVFNYEGDRLPLVSTMEGVSGYDQPYAYATQDLCVGAIQRESELFSQQTGLAIFVAYCVQDSIGSDGRFAMRIDGFGTPTKRPFISGVHLFTKPFTFSYADLMTQVSESLAQHGAAVAVAWGRSEFPAARLAFRYYSENRITLNVNEYSDYREKEHCQAELGRVTEHFFRDQTWATATLFCGSLDLFGTSELTAISIEFPGFTPISHMTKYEDFETCQQQRPDIENEYRNSGHDVVMSVCSLDEQNSQYGVKILVTP